MDKWTNGEAVNHHPEKEDKPSRWWVLFHLWGGICMKVYVDMSGLSKLILGNHSGSDVPSASSYAQTAALIAFGALAIGYFLSKALVQAINSCEMPKKGKFIIKTTLPILYFAGAVFLAIATAPLFASSEKLSEVSSSPQSSKMKPVMANTTIQSAEGMTEMDLDQAVLNKLETWTEETILQKGRNSFAERGYNPKDFKPKVAASSMYFIAGGKKLGIIKVNMDNYMRLVTIFGIKGTELYRVNCYRKSNHDIPIWSGECGDKVREVFGVSIQP